MKDTQLPLSAPELDQSSGRISQLSDNVFRGNDPESQSVSGCLTTSGSYKTEPDESISWSIGISTPKE